MSILISFRESTVSKYFDPKLSVNLKSELWLGVLEIIGLYWEVFISPKLNLCIAFAWRLSGSSYEISPFSNFKSEFELFNNKLRSCISCWDNLFIPNANLGVLFVFLTYIFILFVNFKIKYQNLTKIVIFLIIDRKKLNKKKYTLFLYKCLLYIILSI